MTDSNKRPATWLLLLFFTSGLCLLLTPASPQIPLVASSACVLLGAFLLIVVVVSVAGPQVAWFAARIIRNLFGRG